MFAKNINGKTFISSILDDSPAARAGFKVGDQILSVNGYPYHPIRSFARKLKLKITRRLLDKYSVGQNALLTQEDASRETMN